MECLIQSMIKQLRRICMHSEDGIKLGRVERGRGIHGSLMVPLGPRHIQSCGLLRQSEASSVAFWKQYHKVWPWNSYPQDPDIGSPVLITRCTASNMKYSSRSLNVPLPPWREPQSCCMLSKKHFRYLSYFNMLAVAFSLWAQRTCSDVEICASMHIIWESATHDSMRNRECLTWVSLALISMSESWWAMPAEPCKLDMSLMQCRVQVRCHRSWCVLTLGSILSTRCAICDSDAT
jgi:hypothetical protein